MKNFNLFVFFFAFPKRILNTHADLIVAVIGGAAAVATAAATALHSFILCCSIMVIVILLRLLLSMSDYCSTNVLNSILLLIQRIVFMVSVLSTKVNIN